VLQGKDEKVIIEIIYSQFPEHSIGSYSSAYFYGADYVELDIQLTKDGHLVTNHDPCLKDTTNVESYPNLFGSRKSSYTFPPYDNIYSNDYLIRDFTLAELKMLRRKMRYTSRNQYFNAEFSMLTLEETIEMLLNMNANFPRKDIGMKVGLYIETKMYNFYKNVHGVDLADQVYETLKRYDLETIAKANAKLPIIIECFEKEALYRFAELSDLPLVYLMFYNNPMVTYNLTEIATFAHGVGPKTDWLFNYDNETANDTAPSKFIEECHRVGLAVHPYSLQDDMLRWTHTPLDEH
jgi:glycerophosphoryl diester phosphodiesterase